MHHFQRFKCAAQWRLICSAGQPSPHLISEHVHPRKKLRSPEAAGRPPVPAPSWSPLSRLLAVSADLPGCTFAAKESDGARPVSDLPPSTRRRPSTGQCTRRWLSCYGSAITRCADWPRFTCPSSLHGPSGCFHFLAVMDSQVTKLMCAHFPTVSLTERPIAVRGVSLRALPSHHRHQLRGPPEPLLTALPGFLSEA